LFGVVREESGAKLVVPDRQKINCAKSKRTIVPEQSGMAKEEMSSLFTNTRRKAA